MYKTFNIGSLDRRIVIQSKTDSVDAYGQPVETFSNLFTNVPAKRVYGPGTEKDDQGENVPEQSVKYEIRYHADIDRLFRVVEDGKVYEIEALEELGRRQGLLLHCKYYGNAE